MKSPLFKCQAFGELSNIDLYGLLKLRAEVFVVEQDCVYLDLDDNDQQAWHVFGQLQDGGEIIACARLLAPGVKYDSASIGRIVTAKSVRREGFGQLLVAEAIAACRALWPGQAITISAQQYLEKFYQGFGFTTESEPYLEDDIPHIRMQLAVDQSAGHRY